MYILLATIIKQDDRGLLSNKMTEVCIFHSCIFHVSSMMHIMCVSRKIGGRGIFSGYLFRCCFQEAVLFSGSGGTLRRGSLGGSHFEWEKFAPGFFYLHQVSWFCTKSRTGPLHFYHPGIIPVAFLVNWWNSLSFGSWLWPVRVRQ